MALSNRCSICPKGAGTCCCPGCKAYFCDTDFINHRAMLVTGLDELTINRDELQEKINKASSQKHTDGSLLSSIDSWQTDTIQKVKRAAHEARQQILKIMNSKQEEIKGQFQTLSQELEQLRETKGVLEQHLSRLKQQIEQINESLEKLSQPLAVEIHTKESEKIAWHRMIYVEDRSASSAQGSHQPQLTDLFGDLPNTTETANRENQSADADEFEPGQTCRIQRVNPIIIPSNSDKFAGTICCHDNQLMYNDYNRTTQTCRLTFIRDIRRPTSKKTIEWKQLETTTDPTDDEWIQDIIYSNRLSSYLLLNRARLRLFNDDAIELNEFHTFLNRRMKRLSCSDKYIYLVSSHANILSQGDEIILLSYDKDEQVCKTFRDIIPSRINRFARSIIGEISDLTVGANDQVIICYRLERRHEVGVCLFNVTNDGTGWSCLKQLLLDECWHDDLPYTPRVDWSEELNAFVVAEYMTGHLIMIDRYGQVNGECRFMHAQNRRESPINLTLSSNNFLCLRYESSINIHELMP